MKCYVGIGQDREEVACIKVGGYFGESALLQDLPTKVCPVPAVNPLSRSLNEGSSKTLGDKMWPEKAIYSTERNV